MREQLNVRLDELKQDFERGKARLEQIETEAEKLRETLLRIAGAVQVLSEELKKETDPPDSPP